MEEETVESVVSVEQLKIVLVVRVLVEPGFVRPSPMET